MPFTSVQCEFPLYGARLEVRGEGGTETDNDVQNLNWKLESDNSGRISVEFPLELKLRGPSRHLWQHTEEGEPNFLSVLFFPVYENSTSIYMLNCQE